MMYLLLGFLSFAFLYTYIIPYLELIATIFGIIFELFLRAQHKAQGKYHGRKPQYTQSFFVSYVDCQYNI